jgi:hypothetical protein
MKVKHVEGVPVRPRVSTDEDAERSPATEERARRSGGAREPIQRAAGRIRELRDDARDRAREGAREVTSRARDFGQRRVGTVTLAALSIGALVGGVAAWMGLRARRSEDDEA